MRPPGLPPCPPDFPSPPRPPPSPLVPVSCLETNRADFTGPLEGVRLSSSAYFVRANGSAVLNSTAATSLRRRFDFLSPPTPALSTSIQLTAHGRLLLSATVTAARLPVSTVRAVLRTRVAYIDRRAVGVAFQLRDALGGVDVETSGLSITAFLTLSSDTITAMALRGYNVDTTASSACSAPDAGTGGVGVCSVQAPLGWFALDGSAVVRVTITQEQAVISDDGGTLQLRRAPLWYSSQANLLSNSGVVVATPVSPRFTGESFVVTVRAHTGGYALRAWGLRLHFDTFFLEYVEHRSSSLFNSPVVDTTAADSVGIAAVGISPGTENVRIISSRAPCLAPPSLAHACTRAGQCAF